jgi:hypothetical protein
MPISPISDIYSLGGYIRSVSDSSAVKRISELALLANSGEKISSQETKDNFVSSQLDDKKNSVAYDFRFQPNVPIAKPLETGKPFNETQKTNKKENDKKSFEDILQEPDTEEDNAPVKDLTGQGYYIVLNNQNPPPERKSSTTPAELWRDRIYATYRLNGFRSNGTLVNLTA